MTYHFHHLDQDSLTEIEALLLCLRTVESMDESMRCAKEVCQFYDYPGMICAHLIILPLSIDRRIIEHIVVSGGTTIGCTRITPHEANTLKVVGR